MTIFKQQRRYINFWFRAIGLYPTETTLWRKYSKIFYIFNYMVALLFLILQLCVKTSASNLIDVTLYTVHFAMIFILWLIHQYNKSALFATITASDYEYRCQSAHIIQQEYNRRMREKLKYFFHITVTIIFGFILSLTNGLILYQFQAKKNLENYLLLPSYLPWEIKTEHTYYMYYLIELAMSLFPAIFGIGIVFYILLFAIEVKFQYSILFSVLGIIKDKIIEKYEIRPSLNSEFALTAQCNTKDNEIMLLIECANHHAVIIRIFGFFVTSHTPVFLTYLIHSSILFVSGIYLLLDRSYPVEKTIQKFIEFGAIFPIAVFLCIVGEILDNMNNDLRYMLYDIHWYSASIEFRRMIIFILLNTQKEKNLNIGVKMKASFSLLASVIRASYSCLNILINVRKN